jgi:hypothetical protein
MPFMPRAPLAGTRPRRRGLFLQAATLSRNPSLTRGVADDLMSQATPPGAGEPSRCAMGRPPARDATSNRAARVGDGTVGKRVRAVRSVVAGSAAGPARGERADGVRPERSGALRATDGRPGHRWSPQAADGRPGRRWSPRLPMLAWDSSGPNAVHRGKPARTAAGFSGGGCVRAARGAGAGAHPLEHLEQPTAGGPSGLVRRAGRAASCEALTFHVEQHDGLAHAR